MASASADLEIVHPTTKDTIQEFLDMIPDKARLYVMHKDTGAGRKSAFLHAYWNTEAPY